MRKTAYILAAAFVLGVFTQCSTKKNTWATRSYHYVTARYNVYFNAMQSYLRGLEAIDNAGADDYNEVLHIYAVSNPESYKAGMSDMDKTIEKCEKGIKLHSIVKKPKKKAGKSKDAAYRAFMAKDEYNPMVQQCWLLMGMAQFHKADFMAAIATLDYTGRHFPENRDVYTLSRIYLARCYTELGWFYEAEDVLNKMSEKNFIPKTNRLFVLAKADLLLRQRQYQAALPYLQNAVDDAGGKLKPRLMYIYAQVLEQSGRFDEAFAAYKACIDKHPSHEMEFNAFLCMAKCYQGSDAGEMMTQLSRLLKKQSNEQYKDRIYYAMGELYARNGDKEKAMEYYQMAIDNSMRNGIDKAKALLALGDIHYREQKFRKAQPLYSEAVPLLPLDYEGYGEISRLSNTLNAVARNQAVVELEDSLQVLATLPESEMVEKVKRTIEEEKKREEEELRRMEEEERVQAIRNENAALGQQGLALGETADKSWYFYNTALVSKGKLQFKRTWGSRSLEDDWRRSDKTGGLGGFDDDDSDDDEELADVRIPVGEDIPVSREDSLADGDAKLAEYLRMIPSSPEKMQASNLRIEDALHNLYVLFENDLRNYPLAEETLAEMQRRFPESGFLPEMQYRRYGMYSRIGDNANAETAKQILVSRYPESQYAKILLYGEGQSDGTTRAGRIDRLYRQAYSAFVAGDSYSVSQYASQAREMYPDASLMPKFEFLDIVSHGRQDGREVFKTRLNELVEKYPDSEIAPVARDMAALAGQGREVVQSKPNSSDITANRTDRLVSRKEFAENLQKAGFAYDPADRHVFMILAECNEQRKNEILFAVATYNFTRFLIKDFDLEVRNLADGVYAIAVKGLENLDEAIWYCKSLLSDNSVMQALSGVAYKAFPISEENLKAVFDKESAERYIEFYKSNNLEIEESETVRKLEREAGFVNPAVGTDGAE